MVKLLKEIANVVRDLQTLGLIHADSVATIVNRAEKEGYTIRVGFRTTSEYTNLCNMMFETVRKKGYTAVPVVFDGETGKYIEFEFRKK